MIEREQVAKILRLNGIDISAPESEIKSILLSAKWHENDVETALTVLRQDPKSKEESVDTLHKIFRSDERLKPETISALLGVDVNLSPQDVALHRKHAKGQLTAGLMLHILLVSLVLSTIFIFISMWYLEIGMFHQAAASF